MKKLFAMLFAAVVLMVSAPQADATHHYLMTDNRGVEYYVDDDTMSGVGTNVVSTNIHGKWPDGSRGHIFIKFYHIGNDWLYKTPNGQYYVTYNNFSAYCRDWLVKNGYIR